MNDLFSGIWFSRPIARIVWCAAVVLSMTLVWFGLGVVLS